MKHLRIKISDSKADRRFDDSISSLSSSKYIIELAIYTGKQKCESIWEMKRC